MDNNSTLFITGYVENHNNSIKECYEKDFYGNIILRLCNDDTVEEDLLMSLIESEHKIFLRKEVIEYLKNGFKVKNIYVNTENKFEIKTLYLSDKKYISPYRLADNDDIFGRGK